MNPPAGATLPINTTHLSSQNEVRALKLVQTRSSGRQLLS